MKGILTILAAALALALQGPLAGAEAVNSSGHCTGLTATDYLTSDQDASTMSQGFVNLPDGHLNFTTSSTGCVVITFSGEAFVFPPTNSYEYMRVRTLLDGNSNCAPGVTDDIFLAGVFPAAYGAHSITRVCKVNAGLHTVQVQFRSQFGAKVDIDGHELTITHN